jgi:hypothetical protein
MTRSTKNIKRYASFGGALLVAGVAILVWPRGDASWIGSPPSGAVPVNGRDRPAGLPEKDRWLAPIPGRSDNRRVRDLANKIAGEFERDRSGLSSRLVDAECKPLVYDIGRDLIAMYPDRVEDLLEIFKSIKAPEVAGSLCGELIKAVVARDAGRALALADSLAPGRSRKSAFLNLGAYVPPTDIASLLKQVRASGFPEEAETIEHQLVGRAGEFSLREIEPLLALHFDDEDMSASLGNSYGNRLAQEKGREAALVVAKGLAEKQQGPTIHGVLSRGSTEDDGPAWLLENLAKIDPAVEFDRRLLVEGTVQWLMADRSPAKGMDWAAQLPDEELRKSAVGDGMQYWLQLNSMDASEWVRRMPAGGAKDIATATLVRFLAAKGDAAMATQWLEQVTNKEIKANLENAIRTSQGAAIPK